MAKAQAAPAPETGGELAAAVARFERATGEVRRLLSDIRQRAEQRARTEATRLDNARATALADASARAVTGRRRAHTTAWDAALAMAGDRAREVGYRPDTVTRQPLRAANVVRIGGLLSAAPVGVAPDALEPPVLLPLIGAGNLHVVGDAGQARVPGLLRTVLLRALTGTGPGQLAVTVVDPELRGLHGPFSALGTADDRLLAPPVTDEPGVDDLVRRLVSEHQRIAGLVGGAADSLFAFREQTRQPIERYHLVVFLDFPRAVSERTATALASLMREGPRHGISVVVQRSATPDGGPWLDVANARGHTVSLRGTPLWSTGLPNAPELAVRLDVPPTDTEINQAVAELIQEAQAGTAPVLPLRELLGDVRQTGVHNAVSGLTVPIGRSGRQTVDISLGNPVAQRHNALVTGAVGQGKSNLLQVIVHGLAARYGPDEVELYLLDMREGVTFFPLAGGGPDRGWLPHARLVSVQTDREYGLSVLEHLVGQFPARADALRRYDGTYQTFREREPETRMPRQVLVIDEFQTLFEVHDEVAERAATQLETLVRKGRGFGIHVILASQAVSHLPALGPQADVVFAQFPTRIALRNSRAESQAALDPRNDEASRLRFRGEAIVNHNFGHPDDNQRFIVALGDGRTLDTIRTTAWRHWHERYPPPLVFDGGQPVRLDTLVEELRRIRAKIPDDGTVPVRTAVLGRAVAVGTSPATAVLSREPGRHLAVIGSGELAAVGALQAAAVSLALQHPAGDAEFVVLNLLGPSGTEATMACFEDLLTRLGFAPEVYHGRAVGPALVDLAQNLAGRPGQTRYVVGFGLDRLANTESGQLVTPEDAMRDLLSGGPTEGTHLLGWWTSPEVFGQQRGYSDSTMPATLLLLRMAPRSVLDLIGPGTTWSGADNRALLWAPRDLTRAQPLVPIGPLDTTVARLVIRTDWDG